MWGGRGREVWLRGGGHKDRDSDTYISYGNRAFFVSLVESNVNMCQTHQKRTRYNRNHAERAVLIRQTIGFPTDMH